MLKSVVICYCVVLTSWVGCNQEPEGTVVAEAYGEKLYDTELSRMITEDVTYEDSIFITKEYIQVWLGKQILLHQAEQLLTPQEKDKSEQLEQYKTDLLTYEVLNKLALQQIDTAFSENDLEAYYEENKDEFELTQNIIKLVFFKIPRSTENMDLLWSGFKKNDETVLSKLKNIAEEDGNYFTNEDQWVYFDDILKETPINAYNQEHYLSNNKFINLNDGSFVFFIKIVDFKIRSTTSPFSMERDNIKEILLMKRQQELVKEIETNLLEDAYSKKEIRIF